MYKVLLVGRPFANLQGRGVERYTRDLVLGLLEANVMVDFLGDKPILKNISKRIAPYRSTLSPLIYDLLGPAGALLGRGSRYDIAHVSNLSSGIIAPLLKSKARSIVVTCHDLYGLATRGLREEQLSARGRLYLKLFRETANRSFARADIIVADSIQTAHEISSAFGSEHKIAIVNPGIASSFRPKVNISSRLGKGYVSIGYVGVLTISRRLDMALKVAQLLHAHGLKLRFTIVGTGPSLGRLRSLTRDLGLEEVVDFKGFVSDSRLVDVYNEFDLLLHPVLYEGFGYTILEAEACGVPVVLFKDAHISPEVASAAFIPADETEAAILIESITSNSQRYESACEQAIRHASSFSLRKMISGVLNVYGKVLGYG